MRLDKVRLFNFYRVRNYGGADVDLEMLFALFKITNSEIPDPL